MMNVLVVGCGLKPMKSTDEVRYVNLDYINLPGVDRVFDLNAIQRVGDKIDGLCYPGTNEMISQFLPADHFDKVIAEDVLEHCQFVVPIVCEFWRILAPGGTLWIRGPAWDEPEILWSDLTHLRAFALRAFDGFDRSTWDGRQYGHYHHFGKYFFKVTDKRKVNKGMEFTLMKEVQT